VLVLVLVLVMTITVLGKTEAKILACPSRARYLHR
jgi:hypothetical protein